MRQSKRLAELGGERYRMRMESHSYEDMEALQERNWWYVARRELIRDLLERFCPQAQNVLDLGCGVGSNALALAKPGRTVIGMDASEEALNRCRVRGVYTEYIRVASEIIPLPDASVDLVVAADVLEHIDDERALAEIRRVLKPNGSLLLTVPAHRWLWNRNDDYSHHLRRYKKNELERRLHSHRFETIKFSSWNFTTVLPVFLVSLLQRFRAKPQKLENNLNAIPSWMNALLLACMRLENTILLSTGLPLGVSFVAFAKKNDQR